MISRNLFKAYIAGLGNGENPIFPNLCYRLMDGVNLNEGEPNFDLTQLAIECMGKRIQPRFVFCDSPAYPNKYEAGTMGCVDGDEVITYQYYGQTYCESIKRMWDRLEEDMQVNGLSEYIVPDCLKIYDGENGFVNVKTAVKNPDMGNWVRLTFEGGRSVLVTADHPIYTANRGRVMTSELTIGDTITPYYSMPEIKEDGGWASVDMAYALGLILVDGNYDKGVTVTLDTKTEQDIICGFRDSVMAGLGRRTTVTEYDRGEKGKYTMIRLLENQKELCCYLTELFGGRNKICRNIPREVFVASKEIRLAFMAGLVDGDGHISNKNNVQIGSTNKELAIQQLALAQSLGWPAKMYMNHYDSQYKEKLRYRVEFAMTSELAKYMYSNKKKANQWNGKTPKSKVFDKVKITKIENLGYLNNPSYDVETETDTFTLSFIRSGNCRTAVRSNVNGSSTPEARGNLAFTTLNLPYIALEAKGNVINKHLLVNEFFRLYNILIDDAIDELHARYDIIKNLKVKDVPFVSDWYQGHEGLTPNDTIEPMVKNGTLSVGFIGLAEALTVLIGKHHGESEQAQRLGLQIVSMLRKKMDKETAKSHLNWSCFATPAESACYTLLNAIKREFGVVKGVSDKDYLTNSCHVPVSFKCDMKTKIDIEAPYHLLCNAGAIFYLEAPSSPKFNPEGCLHLLQYMAKSGIVYGGLNYEHDFCVDCGEQGTFNVCPKCGSKNIRMTKIITGYLSTSDKFNPGKVAEARDRVSHT